MSTVLSRADRYMQSAGVVGAGGEDMKTVWYTLSYTVQQGRGVHQRISLRNLQMPAVQQIEMAQKHLGATDFEVKEQPCYEDLGSWAAMDGV